MAINDNTLDLSKYRGEVRKCPLCSGQTPSAVMDALTSGRACKLCLGQKFVAMCKNCDGTGQFKGSTVWDGGRSQHMSTCTPCGGKGVYPVRKPKDWVDQPVPTAETKKETVAVA